jgi:hypothetical protein
MGVIKMQIILSNSKYSYVASTKVITLASPYDGLSLGQILKIQDMTTGSVFYEAVTQRYPISLSGANITHTYNDDNDTNADELQITIDIGGSPANPISVSTGASNTSAYESVTVADSAIGLTSGTYGDATKAEMTLESGQIRVRKDGTNPASDEGHLVEIGDTIILKSAADIASFKAIRTGSVSGVLKVSYSE